MHIMHYNALSLPFYIVSYVSKKICSARHSRCTRPGNLNTSLFTWSKSDHFRDRPGDGPTESQRDAVQNTTCHAVVSNRADKIHFVKYSDVSVGRFGLEVFISVVALRRARLLLGWLTVYGSAGG